MKNIKKSALGLATIALCSMMFTIASADTINYGSAVITKPYTAVYGFDNGVRIDPTDVKDYCSSIPEDSLTYNTDTQQISINQGGTISASIGQIIMPYANAGTEGKQELGFTFKTDLSLSMGLTKMPDSNSLVISDYNLTLTSNSSATCVGGTIELQPQS